MKRLRLLESSFLEQAPDHLDGMRELTIKPDAKNRPEPDVPVFRVGANTGPDQTWYEPEGIVLGAGSQPSAACRLPGELHTGRRAGVLHHALDTALDGPSAQPHL
ncbi:hypothetical protein GCM10011579_086360 [Streptomyces albiflavescens]|uniref:Uncharacterized protein n=1 Tax=Streptomyces albiflavescens TaxID=1623582 RepID=A0A918D9N0_9ACTN|nr:hypothetical protein GCM10011579_086360 [Streptomyces albiflavescens]